MGPPSDKGGYGEIGAIIMTLCQASMGPPSDKGGYGPAACWRFPVDDQASMGPPSDKGGYGSNVEKFVAALLSFNGATVR